MHKHLLRMFAALLFFFFFIFVQSASSEQQRYDIPIDKSQKMGPDNAPVTLIEFMDFQ